MELDLKEKTDQLLKDLGFGDASESEKARVLEKIQEMMDSEVLYRLLARLDSEDADAMEQELATKGEMTEDERADELLKMIIARTPDVEEVIAKAAEELYTRMRNDVAAVKQYMQAANIKPPA